MKLQLKSLNNTTTEIDVSSNDTVDTIRQKLIETGNVNADYTVKLIESGSILDLDKKISEYPNLKDGRIVIFMQSKKKLSDNKPQTQTSDQPSTNQTAPTVPNVLPNEQSQNQGTGSTTISQESQTPLPSTYNGVHIDMFRQFSIMSVINRVLSDPQQFRQLLMQDQNMVILRGNNPTEFDNIINHPGFLGAGIRPMLTPDEDSEVNGTYSVDQTLNDYSSDDTNNNYSNGQQTVSLSLTKEEEEFIKRTRDLAPHMDFGEIVQYYLICGKDENATLDMVLSIPRD